MSVRRNLYGLRPPYRLDPVAAYNNGAILNRSPTVPINDHGVREG